LSLSGLRDAKQSTRDKKFQNPHCFVERFVADLESRNPQSKEKLPAGFLLLQRIGLMKINVDAALAKSSGTVGGTGCNSRSDGMQRAKANVNGTK
jgi:hypothetical protein